MPIERRTEAAAGDLQNIAFQIAFTNRQPILADKMMDALIAESDMLAKHSPKAEMGTLRPKLVNVFVYTRSRGRS